MIFPLLTFLVAVLVTGFAWLVLPDLAGPRGKHRAPVGWVDRLRDVSGEQEMAQAGEPS
jgi:hypothetical protein